MSKKKGAPPSAPPPKPKSAPAKNPPFLPTLLMLIVLLIAGVCVFAALFGSQLEGGSENLHTGQPTKTESTEPEPTETELPQTDIPGEERPKFDNELLILVNAWNPIPEDYQVERVALNNWPLYVAKPAYDDLTEMLADGMAEGLYFQVCSAYRTREEQQGLFDGDVDYYLQQGYSQAMAEAEAALYTQRPGCSEHQTGLALDIVANSYQHLDEGQEKTEENQWMRAHCHEYGFILRYPKDKEGETGISYESWHFRYVGREAAAWLTEQNLTLEEYWSRYGNS